MLTRKIRGQEVDHVVIRLLAEGVPVRALSRALIMPLGDVQQIASNAQTAGQLMQKPMDDWQPGPPPPDKPYDTQEVDGLAVQLGRTGFTPAESKMLALLATYGFVDRSTLHRSIHTQAENKIVDVYICKIRRKLSIHGTPVTIETQWGTGYWMDEASRIALVASLRE